VRGRKPKAAGRKLAEGDTRKVGARKLAAQIAGEPKASRGLPSCPQHLKGRAREAWIFWSEELAAMSIDCRPDAHMLEGACVAYDAAVDAYETIQKQGRLIAKKALDPATNKLVVVDVKPHPAVRQGNQAWALMRSFCSEFGLSPVSRVRLSIEKEDSGDADLLELLGRPREKRTPPIVVQ
jgi:P27 family predicted phage terminase small subunit